jgi:peptidyl-prolyl cis-trans isomerase SurA
MEKKALRNTTILFFALCILLILPHLTIAKVVEEIIVVVNDDVITKTELEERLSKSKELLKQMTQYDEEKLDEEIEKDKPEILEQMVDELLFVQEAIKKGITVSEDQIQLDINELKKQYGSDEVFEKALKAQGYTLESLKRERKRTLLLQELIRQKFESDLRFTDDEVIEFYRQNRSSYSDSDIVKLKNIFVRFNITKADEQRALTEAQDILEKLQEGASFEQMAKEFSDHEPTRESGGDMGYFVPDEGRYDPQLESVASQLAVGEVSGLIKSPGGYDIIKVVDKKDAEVRARRIYIAIEPDPQAEKVAKDKVDAVMEELKSGADFIYLVKKYSEDPRTREIDGDWNEIYINEMSSNLRDAFDSIEEGEISRPVRTPLGFHIFKVVERRDPKDLTPEEMEQVREFLRQKKLAEKLSEYSEKLREKAYIRYIRKLAENKGKSNNE